MINIPLLACLAYIYMYRLIVTVGTCIWFEFYCFIRFGHHIDLGVANLVFGALCEFYNTVFFLRDLL